MLRLRLLGVLIDTENRNVCLRELNRIHFVLHGGDLCRAVDKNPDRNLHNQVYT